MKELAGKTAFVTGAASGIGLGIATAFAQAGAKVMLCDIEEAALSAALTQLRLTNVDVDGVKADVSLKAELVAAAEATTARYGKVHISSTTRRRRRWALWHLDHALWNWTMGVNLMATGQPGRLHHRAYLGARRIAVVVDRSCEPLARHQRKQRRCGPAIAAIAAATQPGKLERGSPGHVVEAYRARRRHDRVGTSEDLAEHPQFPKERYRRGIV